MERAGNFIRFVVIPIALFCTAGVIMAALVVGCVFMAIGTIRHLKNLIQDRV